MRIHAISALTAAIALGAGTFLAANPPGSEHASAQGGLPHRVSVGMVVRDGTGAVNQAGFTTSASGDVDGRDVSIDVKVRARAAGTVVIDVETYDSVGRRIDQQWVDNVSFSANQERTVAVGFTAPAGVPGPFTVKVGIFEPGPYWGLLLHWNNSAAVIE